MARLRIPATLAVVLATLAACGPRPPSSGAATPAPADSARPAPDSFKVRFETSKGRFTVQAVRAWAPRGADRFYHLVNSGFYDGVRFQRVLPNFVVQFGINGNTKVNEAWRGRILDDSVKQSNQAGFLSFASGGPNTRTTQVFINKVDNRRLDSLGFAPFARVIDGMHVVEQFYAGYGEAPPRGGGPEQGRMSTQGSVYLERFFPRLDSVVRARVVTDP